MYKQFTQSKNYYKKGLNKKIIEVIMINQQIAGVKFRELKDGRMEVSYIDDASNERVKERNMLIKYLMRCLILLV